MKLKPIIKSLLELDLYKINMQQIALHKYSNDTCIWSFKCRNDDVVFTNEMVEEITEQIKHYCTLKFEKDELEYLEKNLPWLTKDYIEYLRLYRPNFDNVFINATDNFKFNDCGLTIEARGTWLSTMLFEIPVLSIVNEVYFAFKYGEGYFNEDFKLKSVDKFIKLCNKNYDIGTFSEFGLRRRYSGEMQEWLIEYMLRYNIPGLIGTSNVYLAKKYGIKAVGTMSHEYITMTGLAQKELNPAFANSFAMKSWTDEYGVNNGIYLTDLIGSDVFLKDFNFKYATLFNGLRHDSGDPIEWGEKMLKHYSQLGINPATKTLLFSDSLNFEKATRIKRHFDGRCKVAFGIGTYLSGIQSDIVMPLNIVMKILYANGNPVAKLSDVEGKTMTRSEEYVKYLRRCVDWRMNNEN